MPTPASSRPLERGSCFETTAPGSGRPQLSRLPIVGSCQRSVGILGRHPSPDGTLRNRERRDVRQPEKPPTCRAVLLELLRGRSPTRPWAAHDGAVSTAASAAYASEAQTQDRWRILGALTRLQPKPVPLATEASAALPSRAPATFNAEPELTDGLLQKAATSGSRSVGPGRSDPRPSRTP